MARIKLSNHKGWVRLKPASLDEFKQGEEFVVKHDDQYLVAFIPQWSNTMIVAKYKNDKFISSKEAEVFRII
jgi:hypothetical protein